MNDGRRGASGKLGNFLTGVLVMIKRTCSLVLVSYLPPSTPRELLIVPSAKTSHLSVLIEIINCARALSLSRLKRQRRQRPIITVLTLVQRRTYYYIFFIIIMLNHSRRSNTKQQLVPCANATSVEIAQYPYDTNLLISRFTQCCSKFKTNRHNSL